MNTSADIRTELNAYIHARHPEVGDVTGITIFALCDRIARMAEIETVPMGSSTLTCLNTASRIVHAGVLEERYALAWVADALCYFSNDGTPRALAVRARG